MGNNPVGKKVNTPKGKYPGKYLFTFGIRVLLEPYRQGEKVNLKDKARIGEWEKMKF